MVTSNTTFNFTLGTSYETPYEAIYECKCPIVPMTSKASAMVAQSIRPSMVEDFFTFLQASEKTHESYKLSLKQFFLYLQEVGETQPSKATIVSYVKYLQAKGKKPSTISAYLSAVKALFRYLDEVGAYGDIARNVKAPKQAKGFKKDALTIEQTKEVLNAFDPGTDMGKRDLAIFLLMVVNGLRTIEVSRLKVEDMRVSNGVQVLYVQGKGRTDKDAKTVLAPNVEKAIRAYLATRGEVQDDEPLFTSTSNNNLNQALSAHTISSIAKGAMRKVGLDSNRLTAHSLRHTAITLGLLGGATLEQASTFARHSNLSTTMIYNHSIEETSNPISNIVEGIIFSTNPIED